MKKILMLLLMVVCVNVNAETTTDREAILSVLETQRKAWNMGDIEGYMQGYWNNDSLVFVGANGPTYGFEKTLENYKKSYPTNAKMGQLSFDIKKVEFLSKNIAFVMGRWNLKRTSDEPKGHFTLIFKKFKNQWKIISDHSS